MDDVTPRLALPFLAAGQAQKEMTHNEALAALDMLVQPVVETGAANTPPGAPAIGSCWLVGATPTAAWTGHAAAIAGWTAGGWRFAAAREGMRVRIRDAGRDAVYAGGAWTVEPQGAAIAAPTGGTTIDTQSRAAITAILAALRDRRIIAV